MVSARQPWAFGRLKLTAPPIWLAVVLPLAYFAAADISLSLFGANTPLWVSNSFVVTALLRNKRSTWPALLCLGALADYAANFANGITIVSLGIVACDSAEIFLVAALSRFTATTSLRDGIRPMARLAALCVLVPTVSATGGATLLRFAYGVPFVEGWEVWYLGTASGLLTITPLLLSWTDPCFWATDSRQMAFETLALSGSGRRRRLFRFS